MADARDPQIAFLLAESGIRQLYARYADACWRKDLAAFEDCFTEDAVWKIAGQTLKGREAVKGFLVQSTEPAEKVMFWSGIPQIELGEGTATGRVQVTELIKRKDGGSARTMAIYYDRYVEEDGVWRFALHHFNMYYFGPPDLTAPYFECLEYGAFPGFPGPDEPTTVRNG